MSCKYKVGIGYDIHRFVEDIADPVFIKLCGIKVEHSQSLEANSDGDVALHAVIDAMLGAAGLGDIGDHFPVNDTWKGADSADLAIRVMELLTNAGYMIGNVDLSIICEKPAITPHKAAMRLSISKLLGVDVSCVSVKATTNERIGCIGRKEGIAVFAVVLVYS